MNKQSILRLQLIMSIAAPSIIIIITAIYFFGQQSSFLDRNDVIVRQSQEKFRIMAQLETDLSRITQSRAGSRNPGNLLTTAQSNQLRTEVEENLNQLDQLTVIEDRKPFEAFRKNAIQTIDEIRFNANTLGKSKEEIARYTLDEYMLVKDAIRTFSDAIIQDRAAKLEDNKLSITRTQTISIILITLSLLIFLYTFFKIIQTMNYLRKSSRELKRLNTEFKNVRSNIENSNWVLETNALLTDRISGIDQEDDICDIATDFFASQLPIKASTMYLRRMDSDDFHLLRHTGIVPSQTIQKFIYGEGLLGKIAQDEKAVSIPVEKASYLRSNSALTKDLPLHIIIIPIIYEKYCYGLIEFALDIRSSEVQKYIEFVKRSCYILGSRLKFGQSHILVQRLLSSTQIQTEELEAQQEELRITNEELIHKTHLLESSEEELRVQQEELTQTNIKLNKKAAELEYRNDELHVAQKIVEQKITETEQASKYKSEFMANMSHELRTPLNSILILAKLLHDNKTNNLTTDQIKYAKVIHTAGTDLLELINELLDLAKIESGKVELHLEEIDIKAFQLNIEELFKAIAVDKGINFIIAVNPDLPKHFVSDEYGVRQVLKNFLSNAFKFTNREGSVTFEIQHHDNNLFFSVQDTGKGITVEKQQLIFEAFKQEDGSTSRKYGGTGLGLSISKEIASLLGGYITLESTIGKGSRFTLVIPYKAYSPAPSSHHSESDETLLPSPVASAVPKPISSESTATKKSILIVEDDVNFADILKGFAEDYGFEVLLAHDGAAGVNMAIAHRPDAIILDVMLPISDGWQVLRTLKEHVDTKRIPVHMMSAANFSKRDFLEKGAIGFMQKPVTEDAIQHTFDNINLSITPLVKKILLVEDQELQSDFIKKSFTERGINVIQAFSLASTQHILDTERDIDCIILDIDLPDGSGIDFIDKIKDNPSLADIPIIINTAYELPKSQYDKIISYTKATILKSEKSSERLIDEVNLFLNKINNTSYQPIHHLEKIEPLIRHDSLVGKRVLIADDDMRNVFALSTALQAFDMKIDIANNGKEAIEIIEHTDNPIDIILMDIMMPDMDGYEAIQKIRNNTKYANLPILAVTAKAMKGDREKSIQLGASDYISKPIDIDKLVSLMHLWLS